MVPFLAAYIGYSISDRAALAPCAIGAWVGNSFGAGFFGALIAGMIGGLVVYYLKKIPVHKVLRSVMPIFVISIIGTFITAGIMMWGLGEPIGALTAGLTTWLQGMREGSIVLLAIIMGLMLAFDMGGPVNKVAYAFMLICVSQGVYSVVAIAAVGIAIPPLGMGLATLVGRKYFTPEEREAGKAACQPPGIGVFDANQRGDPGAETRPQTAHQHHQQRRANHQNDYRQRGNTADKRPDNTQHPAIADRARIRFSAGGKRGTRGDNGRREYRPARRFQLKMEADKECQHHRTR